MVTSHNGHRIHIVYRAIVAFILVLAAENINICDELFVLP